MDEFDFWYAVNHTEVVKLPVNPLETFGNTLVEYRLVTELMDEVNHVRVREGRIEATQPTILTPGDLGNLPLEGFDDTEAKRYAEWLQQHGQHLRIIQYGFNVRKQAIKSWDIHEPVEQVVGNVVDSVPNDESMVAVLRGVEQPWEVCLMKLMVELVEHSAQGNVQQMQERNLLPRGESGQRKEIEDDFLAAARDESRLPYLHKKLQSLGVFDDYQDRFFALVASHGK